MTEEEIKNAINRLRNREIEELYVKHEDFMAFREVLVVQDDFKHFKGIAQHGGNVVYRYLDTLRS
ncbi:hypothetical protein BpJC7_27880 [Weizmannia acidilactici]|uniref:Abortive phage infection protein n=1 Tax=Weizmannia acidilactici TaxID=2607726 RepID=A0A5J4JLC0_9BACI|nr:hypothetical protein [Weizmannia acidilactici]GER71485.1 hypothetical protein BpJC7_27880 [Weizmannia acidilactici]